MTVKKSGFEVALSFSRAGVPIHDHLASLQHKTCVSLGRSFSESLSSDPIHASNCMYSFFVKHAIRPDSRLLITWSTWSTSPRAWIVSRTATSPASEQASLGCRGSKVLYRRGGIFVHEGVMGAASHRRP